MGKISSLKQMVLVSIRSAFEYWSLKNHGTGSSRGLSPSELQTTSTVMPTSRISHRLLVHG